MLSNYWFNYLNNPWVPAYEGDGDGGAGDGDKGGAGDGDKGGAGDGAIKFTPEQQTHINKMLADATKAHQEKANKVADELRALQARTDLTASQRQELENRLETIQNELMTAEQRAERERQKVLKESKEKVEMLEQQANTWKSRFTDSTIQRSIIDAAVQNNAFNPEQIVALLRPTTELVDILDDEGQPTGELVPKVKFNDPEGKNGKPAELLLTVGEAVKRMTELDKYFNLFKGEGTGGVGGMTKSGSKQPDLINLATDPAAYREARKKMDL